jgi:hypothetical protein
MLCAVVACSPQFFCGLEIAQSRQVEEALRLWTIALCGRRVRLSTPSSLTSPLGVFRYKDTTGNFCYAGLSIQSDALGEMAAFEAAFQNHIRDRYQAQHGAALPPGEIKSTVLNQLDAEDISFLGQKLNWFLQKNRCALFGFFTDVEGLVHNKIRDEFHDSPSSLRSGDRALFDEFHRELTRKVREKVHNLGNHKGSAKPSPASAANTMDAALEALSASSTIHGTRARIPCCTSPPRISSRWRNVHSPASAVITAAPIIRSIPSRALGFGLWILSPAIFGPLSGDIQRYVTIKADSKSSLRVPREFPSSTRRWFGDSKGDGYGAARTGVGYDKRTALSLNLEAFCARCRHLLRAIRRGAPTSSTKPTTERWSSSRERQQLFMNSRTTYGHVLSFETVITSWPRSFDRDSMNSAWPRPFSPK